MADEILLLLTCSDRKLNTSVPVPASRLYTGQMFLFGMRYADTMGYRVKILSALHGWIDPETELLPYNHRFKRAYTGPFPEGRGFYYGGQAYFKNAPARFQPLVTGARGYGDMLGLICKKQREAEAMLRAQGDPRFQD